ncbi:hypothetical protein ACCAA_650014 [Candidatus Accumulibacter aalborgensis]|uniref:Uncharacterized protein n=1 Tax=Candidatus Accumulibacter aalborgensis TaxID=1860102 RepID=A0A1A8XV41_9PROT|nr:hypothetical protein ACCAA_650014 [Candidatus Accumulibacter aalborgensis]
MHERFALPFFLDYTGGYEVWLAAQSRLASL